MFAKKTRVCRYIAGLLLLVLLLCAFDNRLLVRSYTIDASEISAPVRIALVTDLHSCRYGDNQRDLIEALDEQSPDLVLLAGDIFDDDLPDANAESFIAGIAGRYPCWYVSGNIEYWSGADSFKTQMAILDQYGVKRLEGTAEKVRINGQEILICGVDDPSADAIGPVEASFDEQLAAVNTKAEESGLSVLLSHRPERFDDYAACDFDLVLCGHAHGGQWRIPGLLNGLFAPGQGLFPAYAGGRYEKNDTVMIVSRGLARESTRVPRIFNRPELVTVEVE